MTQKECDPRCTGKCNKRKSLPVSTASKGCDPKCTGRCSKKNAGVSPLDSLPPAVIPPLITPLEIKELDNIGDNKIGPQSKLLQPGDVNVIIMDLDGIILDIEIVYQWVIEDLAGKYGISAEEVPHIIDLQDEETAKKLCTDYNLSVSPQDFMIEFRSTSIKHLANTPLMPGIEKLVDHLIENNIIIAVASTSNEEAFKLKTQKHTEFFKKFSHIVLGGSDPEVDQRKPSPKLYQVCGSRFPSNPDPKKILVLEDASEGVASAKGAQMNVVWFPNKYMKKENDPGALAVLDSIEAFNPEQFGLPPIKK
ncbi:pseudouridine-5'-phosphatase-like [Harmonia axyridis]|uniref:pseudouridine-5'-phosphatase-like n=1 Tax=Harmonia axyridis TaxID=115357 RepID=UPI001E27755F|nr:pseudouridine-5'-phosphatase-like [Harmonia axyridis]